MQVCVWVQVINENGNPSSKLKPGVLKPRQEQDPISFVGEAGERMGSLISAP